MCLSAALLLSLVLSAAPGPSPEREAASQEFSLGEASFGEGDYATALVHFRRAFALAPHDFVRFNIAVCDERLERLTEALEEYEAAAVSPELDEAARLRAQQAIEALRPRLATLVLEGNRVGAAVSVDGRPRGLVPLRLAVDPGPRVVSVRDADGEESQTASPARGETIHLRFDRISIAAPSAPPRPLRWGGAIVALVAVPLAVGFGVRASELHANFEAAPSAALADDGERMRDLCNIAIGAAIVGAAAVGLDWFLEDRAP
ncbi:MAG: hypothetical protein U1E65_21500 [Myxococcota bacterium]